MLAMMSALSLPLSVLGSMGACMGGGSLRRGAATAKRVGLATPFPFFCFCLPLPPPPLCFLLLPLFWALSGACCAAEGRLLRGGVAAGWIPHFGRGMSGSPG